MSAWQKKKTPQNNEPAMATCGECGAHILVGGLVNHFKFKHASGRDMGEPASCPYCHIWFHQDLLAAHIDQIHPHKVLEPAQPPKPPLKPVSPPKPPPPSIEMPRSYDSRRPVSAPKAARRSVVTEFLQPKKTPPSRPVYITDEFGVVHTFDEWQKDNRLGDDFTQQPAALKMDGPFAHPVSDSEPKSRGRADRSRSTSSSQADSVFQRIANMPEEPAKPAKVEPRQHPNVQARCPHCGKLFRQDRLDKHLKYGECPVQMARHVKNKPVHHQSRKAGPREIVKQKPREDTDIKRQQEREELISGILNAIKEKAVEESFDEPRDGSKYLGFMEREQGKFGSYPLHDAYDDEADAE